MFGEIGFIRIGGVVLNLNHVVFAIGSGSVGVIPNRDAGVDVAFDPEAVADFYPSVSVASWFSDRAVEDGSVGPRPFLCAMEFEEDFVEPACQEW